MYLFDGILERMRHAGRIKRKESEKRFSFEAKEIWRSSDVGEDPGTGESNALKVHYRPLQRTEGKSRIEREREDGKGDAKENITRELAPFLLVDPSLANFTTIADTCTTRVPR